MAYQDWRCQEPGCGRYFGTQSHLKHHEITHLPQNTSCYVCSRKFRRYPDMIIYLEGKGCPSGISIDELNRSAAMCFQWKEYIDRPFRQKLLAGDDSYRSETPEQRPFKCPRCNEWFPLLSSLFMHIWSQSPSCGQGKVPHAMKKLKRWLWKRLHWRKQTDNVGVDLEDATQGFKVMALHASF